jgi:hypothetical protein
MEILLIILTVLVSINVLVTIAIAGTLSHLIQKAEAKPENKPDSGLLDLPERQVSYRDTQLMENWDGVRPLSENFDGIGKEF